MSHSPKRFPAVLALNLLVSIAAAGCSSEPAGNPLATAPAAGDPKPNAAAAIEIRPTHGDSSAPIARTMGTTAPTRAVDDYGVPATHAPTHLDEARIPHPDLGPIESPYFDGQFLNEKVRQTMRRKDFESAVLDLQQGGGDDGGMARAYTSIFQASLKPYAQHTPRLGRLACGKVLCMGSLRAPSREWMDAWLMSLMNAQTLPIRSMSTKGYRIGGEYELRFSFTTSGHAGFTGRAR